MPARGGRHVAVRVDVGHDVVAEALLVRGPRPRSRSTRARPASSAICAGVIGEPERVLGLREPDPQPAPREDAVPRGEQPAHGRARVAGGERVLVLVVLGRHGRHCARDPPRRDEPGAAAPGAATPGGRRPGCRRARSPRARPRGPRPRRRAASRTPPRAYSVRATNAADRRSAVPMPRPAGARVDADVGHLDAAPRDALDAEHAHGSALVLDDPQVARLGGAREVRRVVGLAARRRSRGGAGRAAPTRRRGPDAAPGAGSAGRSRRGRRGGGSRAGVAPPAWAGCENTSSRVGGSPEQALHALGLAEERRRLAGRRGDRRAGPSRRAARRAPWGRPRGSTRP